MGSQHACRHAGAVAGCQARSVRLAAFLRPRRIGLITFWPSLRRQSIPIAQRSFACGFGGNTMAKRVMFSTPIGRYRTCGVLDVVNIKVLSNHQPEAIITAQIRGTPPRLDDIDSWYELTLREGLATGSRIVGLRNAKLVRSSEGLIFLAENIIYDERLPRRSEFYSED